MLVPLLLALTQTPKADIEKAYSRWNYAYIHKDSATLDALLSDDFVAYGTDGGRNRDKVEFLGGIMRQFASPRFNLTKFTTTVDKLEQTKTGWSATISEHWTFGDRKGGQVTIDGWRQSPSGWQIVSTRFVRELK